VSAAAETPAESAAAETEAPPEWSETPAEPHHEAPAETPQEAGAEAALAAGGAAAEVATHEFAAEEPHEPAAEEPHQVFVAEEPHHEPAAEQAPPEVFFDEASAEGAEQGELKIEGWIAPPPEPEPQGAGWLGQALEATAPLSAADHGTLASIGVDPNDGVGALRLLAVLVRVLNRGHQLNLDEIGNEIRDSRAQAAAEHAAAEVGANGTPASEDQPPAEPAET
jgi:hypothetical protein